MMTTTKLLSDALFNNGYETVKSANAVANGAVFSGGQGFTSTTLN